MVGLIGNMIGSVPLNPLKTLEIVAQTSANRGSAMAIDIVRVFDTPAPAGAVRASLQRRTPAPDSLPDAVQWSEGMLFSPQHLQRADASWEQQLRHRLAQTAPGY